MALVIRRPRDRQIMMTFMRSVCLFLAIIWATGCANAPISSVSSVDGAPPPDERAEPRPAETATDGISIRFWDDCGEISLPDNELGRPRMVGIAVSPDARWLVATTGRQAY